ncbi:MAG: MFS transporter [Lachnospiraceae bacterium]|nr:MFS transporter [Lachnospiraceae bacterium]
MMERMKKNRQTPNWHLPETTAATEVLPRWFKWAYTGRGLAYSLNFVLMMQITYYSTDILGMPAGIVGMLLLLSKVVDAMTDLIFGYIIDRTNSKLGKGRPYDLFVPVMWFGTVLLFSTPDFGIVGKSIYVFILYALVNSVCSTFLLASDPVYQSRAIRSDKNRMFITTFQGIFALIFSTLVGIMMPQLIKGLGSTKSGWTVIALLFAVPLSILGSIRFMTIKEVNTTPAASSTGTNRLSVKNGLRLLGKNKLVIILCMLSLCSNAISSITQATATYYFKWIFGDVGMASLVSLPTMLTPLFLLVTPILCNKYGTGRILKIGMLSSILGFLIRMVLGVNLTGILIGSLFVAIGFIPIGTLINIYEMECMDYGQWKNGTRIEGMITSAVGFSIKVGSALGSGILGLLMGLSGYISSETVTTQSDTALSMIKILFNLVPLIISLIAFVISLNYTIDKDRAEMNSALQK